MVCLSLQLDNDCLCFSFASHALKFMQGATDFLKGMGLGMIADQLANLKLGELLDTPPPGLDEAVAIAKVRHCMVVLTSDLAKSHASCSSAMLCEFLQHSLLSPIAVGAAPGMMYTVSS